jgi:hypothetical protein
MSENTLLETAVEEPAGTAGEAETALFALERSRAHFAWKCGGLDADALRRTHPPSTMTLGGLVKHLALVEDVYTIRHLGGEPMQSLGAYWPVAAMEPDWVWRSAADDSPEQLYARWRAAVGRSRAAWTIALAERGPDAPSPINTARNLRRVLADLHDEYARHVGHADLLREAVDGLVGEVPPQP